MNQAKEQLKSQIKPQNTSCPFSCSLSSRFCLWQRGIVWIWIAIVVVFADRFTKAWVISHLSLLQPIGVTSYFNLLFNYNPGAAFSFLSNAGGWQDWLFGSIAAIVSGGILVWLWRLPRTQVWISVAASLVLGGTLGNLYDRIVYSRVIDFLDFYYQNWHFPTFNLADTAICIGAIMLILDAAFRPHTNEL